MPVAIPLIVGTLLSTVGPHLFGGGSGGGSSTDPNAAAQQQAKADADKQAKLDAATKTAALRRAAPDAQAQTGGSLTDMPFASLTQSIAGEPGNIQEAMRALGFGDQQQPGLAMSGGS